MQKLQSFPLISRLIGGSFSHRRRGSVGDSNCKIVRLNHDSKLCIWYTFVIDYPVLRPSIHCPSLFQPQSIPTEFHTSLHCTAPPPNKFLHSCYDKPMQQLPFAFQTVNPHQPKYSNSPSQMVVFQCNEVPKTYAQSKALRSANGSFSSSSSSDSSDSCALG